MDRRLSLALAFIVASFGFLGYAVWHTNLVSDIRSIKPTTPKNTMVTTLVAMGDNHTDNEIFHSILKEVATQPYQAFIHLGDSTDQGTALEFSVMAKQMNALPVPTIIHLGTHDLNPDVTDERFLYASHQRTCSIHSVGHVT